MSNTTITIPKELAQKGNLVLIPQEEYEEFLEFKKVIKIVKPTRSELQAIKRGRKEIKEGKYILWHELKKELAHNNR